MARKLLLLFTLTLISAACSLYQSEGREFMEDQGIEKLSAQSKGDLITNGYCLVTPPLKVDHNRYVPMGLEDSYEIDSLTTYMSSSLSEPRALIQYQDKAAEQDYICILNYSSLGDLNFEIQVDFEEALEWVLNQLSN